ncbi:MAG: YggT family protein [Geobacter sp.]|nr:YggT family protein [Geobacter sp.]
MFILGNLLISFAKISDLLLTMYMYIIIASALLSWVNPDPYNPIVKFLHRATDPVLYKIRSKMPYMGGIDLSPLVVILAITFVRGFVVQSVKELGYRLNTGAF